MLDDNGKVVEGYGRYSGMDRYEARKAIVADLEEQGYLVKVEPHQHNVGTCYRCHNDVEPLISAQWFVKMKPLAEDALRVVNEGEVKFVPDRFSRSTPTGWRTSMTGASPASCGGATRFPPGPARSAAISPCPRTIPPSASTAHSKNIKQAGRCAGHLVLLRSVALLHPGLA